MAETNETEAAEFGTLFLRRHYERAKRLFDAYPQDRTPTAEDLVRVALGGPINRNPPVENPPPTEDTGTPET